MSQSKIKFYFPRWIFPNNLGDSLICTFVPKILKKIYPNSELEIITYGFLIDLFKLDKNVDIVREPTQQELYLNFQQYAFSEQQEENIKVVYPDWHPKVFSFWKNNHDFLVNHKSVNIIALNYLLQLGLENLIFSDFDFYPNVNIPIDSKKENEFINVGIVPATKLSGKNTPHPNCDGIGFRFNGPNGLDSWKKFVTELKSINNKVKIFEFSKENFGLGDYHFKDDNNIFTLINNIDNMDIGIMSDGGLHHAFNSRKKPIVLFQAGILCKVEFLKLGNAFYPEYLHLECRKSCPSFFTETFGGVDLSKNCKRECENLSPKLLAEYTAEKIKIL